LIIHLINQLIIADRKEIQKTIEIEGRERQRIAADLHDGFGAYLSSIIMHIQILENDYGENLVLRKKIENLNQLSRQALQSIEATKSVEAVHPRCYTAYA
jgi:signal transduction histidine kinase